MILRTLYRAEAGKVAVGNGAGMLLSHYEKRLADAVAAILR
jgi:hypothetical protein